MSYIKNYIGWKRIYEQANLIEKSKYGEYSFDQLFPDNMITPKKESYESVIQQMATDLKKAISEGRELTDIKIKVESSASSQNPTRAIPAGYAKLDHNYGGGNPSNEFLAKNRGINMKNVIVQELSKMGITVPAENILVVPRPDGKWVATSEDESEQYVKVKIEGLFERTPPPPPEEEKEYTYSIVYSWYQIGESNKKYILIDGSDDKGYRPVDHSIWPQDASASSLDKFKVALNSAPEDIEVAGYSISGPNQHHSFFAFSPLSNYAKVSGNIFSYADEASWLKDVNTLNKINPAKGFRMRKGDVNSKELVDGINAKGYFNPGKGGQANFEHGTGNYNTTINIIKPGKDKLPTDDKGRVSIKQWSSQDKQDQ
jgi:hypothetical protein